MKTATLRLVTIIAEDDLEDVLLQDLKRLGVRGYTVGRVRGEGGHGARTSAWEGENIRVESVVDEALADRIAGHLAEHYFPSCAVVVYFTPIEVLRAGHFTGEAPSG